jgi:uncharacterized Fe-S cluster-containing radical SAM superfamily protein
MAAPFKLLNTDHMSSHLRARSIDPTRMRLLMARFPNTDQEKDLAEPPNCDGFGRIRHFRRSTSAGWPPNPLPLDAASRALGLPPVDVLRAQVFQNAACNWRCWYCYVPFEMLSANPKYAEWVSVSRLIELYAAQPDPPTTIDLTGGQPDLVPEWIPWTMRELRERGLATSVYLWSDDNLSNDYLWRCLTAEDHELIASYPNYGRVGCFKGFNSESFSFNTRAAPELFDQQFALMARLLELGIDLYAYVTLTAPSARGIDADMARFVDRLQTVHPNLPLRTIPLEIRVYTPVEPRLREIHTESIRTQQLAVEAWCRELEARYPSCERERRITDVPLRGPV